MITIKNKQAQKIMIEGGALLAQIFADLSQVLVPGKTTLAVDQRVAEQLDAAGMVSQSKGYHGYRHVSCVSVNDEIVHGVPSAEKFLREGDIVSVDICAAWRGYCVDAARTFFVGSAVSNASRDLVDAALCALQEGIDQAWHGNRLGDVSAAIQCVVEKRGFSVVRDFCGHGIGKKMHEAPDIPNYGSSGQGPLLKAGMALALEPMITAGNFRVSIDSDGWTARTVDGSLAAHVEDTVLITENGPRVVTRLQ